MSYQEPEFLPWDGRRVPITFVGGYLGAGKTSAINEVLSETDRPIAVIVNDVGAINIDAALIRKRSGDTIELTDGCVCCSSLDGFGAAFDQIRDRPEPPDHVVVELSGVAEPANVVPWGSSAGFLLDGVVVVAAVDQLVEATIPDWVRVHLDRQIAEADLVVLTKADLAEPDAISAAHDRLEELAPGVAVVDGSLGRREPGALGRFLALGGHRAGDATRIAGPTLFDLHQTDMVPSTVSSIARRSTGSSTRSHATSAARSHGRRVCSTPPTDSCSSRWSAPAGRSRHCSPTRPSRRPISWSSRSDPDPR